jgi:hypothetical protein
VEQGRDPVNALFGIASVHSATHMACHCTVIYRFRLHDYTFLMRRWATLYSAKSGRSNTRHVRRLLPSRILPTSKTRQDDQCRASALAYFHGIAKFEDAARGFNLLNFERSVKNKAGGLMLRQFLVTHRRLDI